MVMLTYSQTFLIVPVLNILPNIKYNIYGKCPKTLYTTFSGKMTYANQADPDLTAPQAV